jgi:hypothetical protein
LGHHAQTRKLVTDNHIVVPADPRFSHGEMKFMTWMESQGYTAEYKYDPSIQA